MAKRPLRTKPDTPDTALTKAFREGLEGEAWGAVRAQLGGSLGVDGPSLGVDKGYIEPRLQKDFVVLNDTTERLVGCEPGFDRKVLKKLERGEVAPTAVLDLHGHTADVFVHLFNWLREAVRMEHRSVLIICGKGRGYGPKKDMGLIKSQLPEWLARHPYVMAYATAMPVDGGAGAVYVFLRRDR